MILITGGTGFIGQALIRQLAAMDRRVCLLIRPSQKNPTIPKGSPIDIAVCSLQDERGLRAAMKGVEVVYHLIGGERRGHRADLMEDDVQPAKAVVQAAVDAGVERFFYLSHLGADRASAYPVLKAKAIAEGHIRQSGIDYTILRTAIVFGPNDNFTMGLANLLHGLPFFFLIPGDGRSTIQPLWVEDLVTCLVWSLDNPDTRKAIFQVGGPEFLEFKHIVEIIKDRIGARKTLLNVGPVYLRGLTTFFERLFPNFPVSEFWLDYLATNRTCGLDTVPRVFGLVPSRFEQRLDYLQGQNWNRNLWRLLMRGRTIYGT